MSQIHALQISLAYLNHTGVLEIAQQGIATMWDQKELF